GQRRRGFPRILWVGNNRRIPPNDPRRGLSHDVHVARLADILGLIDRGVPDRSRLRKLACALQSRRPERSNLWPRPSETSRSARGRLPRMTDVTGTLSAIEQGDPRAADQLLPLVYDELRQLAAHKLAQEAPGHTLQPTALVHEAYLRLVGDEEPGWQS